MMTSFLLVNCKKNIFNKVNDVGMSFICSAVSYVVAEVNLCIFFRECLAYRREGCIANVLG